MKLPLRLLAQHCKNFAPLLAAPAALLLLQGQAKAVLTYNIFEFAGNIVIQTSGSLNLTGAATTGSGFCGVSGAIQPGLASICTGPGGSGNPINKYAITGPATFGGSGTLPANSVTGISNILKGDLGIFGIDPAYTSNTPIVSSATFNGTTLASLGLTTPGLIGTWTINGTSETIDVVNGAPSAAAVPGPLPLFGAGAAFGWSRRLRKRIAAPLSTLPQA